MKKKTLLIVLAIVIVGAVSAAAAYAWWSSTDAVADNVISTGGVDIVASDTSMSFPGLMPGATAPAQFMWVRNDGSAPVMMYAYVEVQAGSDPALANYLNASITLAPRDFPTDASILESSLGYAGGPWPVYDGVVANLLGPANGKQYLRTITPDGTTQTPMTSGQYALYKVVLSLSPDTPNTFQNQTVRCDVVFVGGQVESGLTLDF